jgi:hypothetical protein
MQLKQTKSSNTDCEFTSFYSKKCQRRDNTFNNPKKQRRHGHLKNKRNRKFEQLLLKAVDEAFQSLGFRAKKCVYSTLEEKFKLKKQDIPERLDVFSNALDQIFSVYVARYMEILIMAKLHEEIDCSYRWVGPNWLVPDFSFKKYVILLKLAYEKPVYRQMEVFVDAGLKAQVIQE